VIITHDMGVIAEIAHRVVVMYAGRPPRSDRNSTSFDRRATPTPGGYSARYARGREDSPARHDSGNAVSPLESDRLCVRAALSDRMDICADARRCAGPATTSTPAG